MKSNKDKINQQEQYIEIEWYTKHAFDVVDGYDAKLNHCELSALPLTCRALINVNSILSIDRFYNCYTFIVTRTPKGNGHRVFIETFCLNEDAGHFRERLDSQERVILLDDYKPKAATSETDGISDRPSQKVECREMEVKGISEYTAAALMLEIQEESLAPVDDIGFVPDTTNTTVSVCVRHGRDRTDCRISHLESKDGHITIVCDADVDEEFDN